MYFLFTRIYLHVRTHAYARAHRCVRLYVRMRACIYISRTWEDAGFPLAE